MFIRCGTKPDYDTLTLAKLGSLLVKRLIKLNKDFMHSPAATPSVPIVVGKSSALKLAMKGVD